VKGTLVSVRSKGFRFASIALLVSAVVIGEASGQSLVIRDVTLFDGTGAPPRRASVVVENGRITQVADKVDAPRDARVLKAKGQSLLPGLIDVHTHWTPSGEPSAFPDIATQYVLSGVTTVDDFHSAPEAFEPKRAWLKSMTTPHVNYTARTSTPGGHGADWGDVNMTRWVSTPRNARAAVQELMPYQPDSIKAFMDGWRYGTAPDNTSMNEDTLTALVDEAHKNKRVVLTHTVTVERAKVASRAGVDVIAHAIQNAPVDDELVGLMKSKGTAYAPTLAVYEPKPEKLVGLSAERLRQVRRRWAFSFYNLRTLRDAGVTVVLGTDAGMEATPHGESTLRELELLVEAGLTPTEALLAGTANAAKSIGLQADRGTIEPGKRADFVLVEGEPWRAISDMRKIRSVVIDGAVVAQGGKLTSPQPAANPPSVKAQALIDDFERADGRTSLNTLRLDNTDGGVDRSRSVSQIFRRTATDHALSLAASMSRKDDATASVVIPLSRGSVTPVDAAAFSGVRFEIRGDGASSLNINAAGARWTAPVSAAPEWREVRVPFASFKSSAADAKWSGTDLLSIELGGTRPAGANLWMEVDNVGFY
jgi:imidazolonepropionase-like amidohydrolase